MCSSSLRGAISSRKQWTVLEGRGRVRDGTSRRCEGDQTRSSLGSFVALPLLPGVVCAAAALPLPRLPLDVTRPSIVSNSTLLKPVIRVQLGVLLWLIRQIVCLSLPVKIGSPSTRFQSSATQSGMQQKSKSNVVDILVNIIPKQPTNGSSSIGNRLGSLRPGHAHASRCGRQPKGQVPLRCGERHVPAGRQPERPLTLGHPEKGPSHGEDARAAGWWVISCGTESSADIRCGYQIQPGSPTGCRARAEPPHCPVRRKLSLETHFGCHLVS